MQKILNRILIAFMSGLISAFVLLLVFTIIQNGALNFTDDFKYKLYKLMIWGGIWSILFALPINKNILIKSSIIGIAVIMFNFLVKMPLTGMGFFAINAGLGVFFMNIIFNYIWAILAGLVYVCAKEK